MEYTLYAPQNTIRTNDLDDIKMMLALPKLARFIPSSVLTNPSVIANRRDSIAADPAASPVFTTLRLEFDADEVDDFEELADNVATWAKRCRLAGVSGPRLAVVSEMEDNGNTLVFTVQIGTVVFYNDRRVTVDVSTSDDELRRDLENLFPYVPVRPEVSRVDEKTGELTQVYPHVVAPLFSFGSSDPAQSLPVASLDSVLLSLIRLGAEAAPLLVNRDQMDVQVLRDYVDNLQNELASVRTQLG